MPGPPHAIATIATTTHEPIAAIPCFIAHGLTADRATTATHPGMSSAGKRQRREEAATKPDGELGGAGCRQLRQKPVSFVGGGQLRRRRER